MSNKVPKIEEILNKNNCPSLDGLAYYALHTIALDLQNLRDDIEHGYITSKDAIERLDEIIFLIE